MGIQSYKYGASGIDGALEAFEMGMGMPGRTQYVAKAGGTFEDWISSRYRGGSVKPTLEEANAELESGRGDTIYVSAESYSLAATLTVSANICRMFGLCAPGMLNVRSRIGHSAIVTSLLTVSGYGNHFKNLYLMYGMTGMSASTTPAALTVSGNRNVFENCHIGAPMHEDLGDNANFDALRITGEENLFKNCVIGVDTIMRSAANALVEFGSGSKRNMFENCLFLSANDNAGAFFINVASGADRHEIFRNCQFIGFSADSGTPMTYAVSFNNATSSGLIFDHKSFFVGATDIVAAANEARLWFGPATATATGIGLAVNPDVA